MRRGAPRARRPDGRAHRKGAKTARKGPDADGAEAVGIVCEVIGVCRNTIPNIPDSLGMPLVIAPIAAAGAILRDLRERSAYCSMIRMALA